MEHSIPNTQYPISAALPAGMTLEEKVGQVMMIGFDPDAGRPAPELTPEFRALLQDLHIGGVVYFERNVESPAQLAKLSADLQEGAWQNGDPPLLISIDQEGGRVARLKEARGFTEFPGAMAIAATGDIENARRIARALAEELLAVGINMDLAPDLDVNNNPDNPVIGIRSFGSDPQAVAAFGVAFAQGLQAEGVLAVGKHFPGHGDTGADSHVSLPTVPHDRARLEAVEFVPFRAAIHPSPVPQDGGGAGVGGIMSAHITFPAVDPTPGLAATLSAKVLTGLLRDELGYDGLALTDSLEMGALGTSGYPVPMAAATSLKAGADVLTISHGLEIHRQAHAMVVDWVRRGQIPQKRLDEAVRRVLAAKERFGLLEDRGQGAGVRSQESGSRSQVGSAEHKALSRQVAAQGITLLRDDAGLLPLKADAKLLVIEPPAAAGMAKALAALSFTVSANPTAAEITTAVGLARDGCTVIVATADAKQSAGQAKLVRALLDAKVPTIVVAVRSPYDLLAFPEVPTYLATYGLNPPALDALVEVLNGRVKSQGRLPVELPGLYKEGAGQ
ncbi:MAG: beta-N-acetylhexosaminidase [Chloroflexi bacterium]|nr:beta-N-acetylhexosaminidase [Chloroflexota bacterium]